MERLSSNQSTILKNIYTSSYQVLSLVADRLFVRSLKEDVLRNSWIGLMALLVPHAWAQAQDAVPGEYIVKYRHSVTSNSIHGKIFGKASLKNTFGGTNMYHISLKTTPGADSLINELKNDPDVAYIEPNYKVRLVAEEPLQRYDKASKAQIMADGLTMQSTCSSTDTDCFVQHSAPVKVREAWLQAVPANQGEKPIVAVIDTGVDITHELFQNSGAIYVNQAEIAGDNLDNDHNGYIDDISGWNFVANASSPTDDEGHGTHVAGIVVGAGINIFANAIEESRVKIMPLKFLAGDGSGTTADAIRAIYYAVDNGASIINNSWGGPSYSQGLLDAMAYAYQHHVLIVSAAGNASTNNDTAPMYPAALQVPSNLAVASTTSFDNLSSFSNYGATTVHIASPGSMIYSSYPGNLYVGMSGTSMAAPFVSGVAALILRESPNLTGYQLKQNIMTNGDVLASLSGKVQTGARINVERSVIAAKAVGGTLAGYQPDFDAAAAARAPASDSPQTGGGCGLVKSIIEQGTTSGATQYPRMFGFMVLLLIPILVYGVQRTRSPGFRRKFERFQMDSEIKVKIGERELVAHMKTISLGGLSFSAESALEKGGIITMKIASPDGQELVEVQGQVVWCEKNQAYGVQFANASDQVLSSINGWTKTLLRTG